MRCWCVNYTAVFVYVACQAAFDIFKSRMQNVLYIAMVVMTLSIHSWTMVRESHTCLIRIWLQGLTFIYAAWNVAKISSLRHLSHLRNALHAAAVANRSASSKRLKVTYLHHIDTGIFTMVFGQLEWLTTGSGLLWRWRHFWWSCVVVVCVCLVVKIKQCYTFVNTWHS